MCVGGVRGGRGFRIDRRIKFIMFLGRPRDGAREKIFQDGAVDKTVFVAGTTQQTGISKESFLRIKSKKLSLPCLPVSHMRVVDYRSAILLLKDGGRQFHLVQNTVA